MLWFDQLSGQSTYIRGLTLYNSHARYGYIDWVKNEIILMGNPCSINTIIYCTSLFFRPISLNTLINLSERFQSSNASSNDWNTNWFFWSLSNFPPEIWTSPSLAFYGIRLKIPFTQYSWSGVIVTIWWNLNIRPNNTALLQLSSSECQGNTWDV